MTPSQTSLLGDGGISRLLVIRLSALGDCMHATPIVAALADKVEIGWAIEPGGYELLRGLPGVQRFHLFPRKAKGLDRWRALLRFRRELREARYDAVLDLQGLTKSGLVAWLSGAGLRLGFAGRESRELNSLFLNRRLAVPEDVRHVVDRNLHLLAGLGEGVPSRASFLLPDWDDAGRSVDDFLGRHGWEAEPFAVVNPGTTWVTKLWPSASFAEVAKRLAERLPVVVTWGSEAEARAAREIVDSSATEWVVQAPPTDLRELSALIGRAALFVGNDTGPMHFAAAQDVPCVALFGATDPQRNGPYGDGHRVLVTELDCRPCLSTRCARGDLACLTRIEPSDVVAACHDLLDRAARPGDARERP